MYVVLNVVLNYELSSFLSDIIDKLVKRIHPDRDLDAKEEKKWRKYVFIIASSC